MTRTYIWIFHLARGDPCVLFRQAPRTWPIVWRGTKPWCNICERSGRSGHQPTCGVRQYGSRWVAVSTARRVWGWRHPDCHPSCTALVCICELARQPQCMLQAPPGRDPDRGGDTDCTIGMGWERGGTPSCQCSMGTPLLEPHGTPALRSVLPTAQRSYGYGAFLVRRCLPLIHKLCFLRITDAEYHAPVAKPKCDPYLPRLQQKPGLEFPRALLKSPARAFRLGLVHRRLHLTRPK